MTTLSSIQIRAPYAPLGVSARPSSPPAAAGVPLDLVTFTSGSANAEARSHGATLGILAGAVALAIAAPILLHPAQAPVALPAVAVAVVAAEQVCSAPERILSIEQQDAFDHASTPRDRDNDTARETRGRLRQVTEQLTRDLAAFQDGVQRIHGDAASAGSDTLEMTATAQTLRSGNVTRVLHRAAHDGFQAGDFEVLRQEGTRRQSHVVLSGSTLRVEVHENISGFAGNIRKDIRESFSVPAMSIEVYPSVDVRYEASTRSLSHPVARESTQTREVEVYSDGSTRVRSGDGVSVQEQSEPPAEKTASPTQTQG